MGNGNGPVKVLGLTLREFIILASALIAVVVFFIKTSAEVSSWQTHVIDRMDTMEKHIDHNDLRIDKLDDSLDLLRERLQRHMRDPR